MKKYYALFTVLLVGLLTLGMMFMPNQSSGLSEQATLSSASSSAPVVEETEKIKRSASANTNSFTNDKIDRKIRQRRSAQSTKDTIETVLQKWAKLFKKYWKNEIAFEFSYTWDFSDIEDCWAWWSCEKTTKKTLKLDLSLFQETTSDLTEKEKQIQEIKNFIEGDPNDRREFNLNENSLGLKGNKIEGSPSPNWITDFKEEESIEKTTEGILAFLLEKKWTMLFDDFWKEVDPVLEEYSKIHFNEKVEEIKGDWLVWRKKIENLIIFKNEEKDEIKEKIKKILMETKKDRSDKIKNIQAEILVALGDRLSLAENSKRGFFTSLEKSVTSFGSRIEKIIELFKRFFEIKEETIIDEFPEKVFQTDFNDEDKIQTLLFNNQVNEKQLWKILWREINDSIKLSERKEKEYKELIDLRQSVFQKLDLWERFEKYWISSIEIKTETGTSPITIEYKNDSNLEQISSLKLDEIRQKLSKEIKKMFSNEYENVFEEQGNSLLREILIDYKMPIDTIMINNQVYRTRELINESDNNLLSSEAQEQWRAILKANIENKENFEEILKKAKNDLRAKFWKQVKKWLTVLQEVSLMTTFVEENDRLYNELKVDSEKSIAELDEQQKAKLDSLLKNNYQEDNLFKSLFLFLEKTPLKMKINFINQEFQKLKRNNVVSFWFERLNLETKHLQKNIDQTFDLQNLQTAEMAEVLELLEKRVKKEDFEQVALFNQIQKVHRELIKNKARIEDAGLKILKQKQKNIFINNLVNQDSTRRLSINQRNDLASLMNKNIKTIINQTIDTDLSGYWNALKSKISILKKYQIKTLFFKTNDVEQKINLNKLLAERKEKPSEFVQTESLQELRKTTLLSQQQFKKVLSQTIQKNEKLFNVQLGEEKVDSGKEATILGGSIVGGTLVISGALCYFFARKKY